MSEVGRRFRLRRGGGAGWEACGASARVAGQGEAPVGDQVAEHREDRAQDQEADREDGHHQGDEGRQRLLEAEAAFFEQGHESHADKRFGHRIDAKNGVVLDRRLALDVGKALHGAVDDLAAAVHQHLRSRKAADIDVSLLQMCFDAVEGRLGHAGVFGRGDGRG